MDKAEIAHKLDMIRELSRDELRGWWLYVMTRGLRPEFDGERSALLSRSRELGLTLE
jgi:hypothetical protein